MAPNFKFCSVLWIVVAVIAAHTVVLTEAATFIPTTTTTTTTTAAPDPCASNPCGKGSTCEARFNQGFVCLCLAGDNYNNKTQRCETAKVFPGQIQLPDIVYENSMSDKASPAFKQTVDHITEELDKSLGSDPTYIQSIVLKLWPAANSQLRALTGVNASVELIYSPESNITASDVVAEVKKATECTDCPLAGGSFTEEDLCERNACDENSTRCSSKDGTFNCTCLDGYVSNDPSTRICHMAPTAAPAPTTTTTRAPVAPGSCASNPCGKGSTCEARATQGFVCLCLAGDMYNYITGSCVKAKVFPAHLNLPNIPYENNMSDKASPMFKETADRITQELDEIFSSDPTYVRSIVLKLWSAVNSQLREAQGTNTSIEIIFSAVSNITTRHILYELGTAIATSCNTCTLKGAAVVDENLCDRDPCEELTTTCSSNDGNFTCTCKEGHIPTDSLRRCHVCPSGQKAGDSECINCPFGYSGFNCNESWQLILVIIGSVFTALLLIAIILLPLLIRKFSKKKSKTDTSSKTSLINGHSLNSHASVFDKGSATGLAVFTKNGVLRLPRATVNSSWNSTTRLEMTASNS